MTTSTSLISSDISSSPPRPWRSIHDEQRRRLEVIDWTRKIAAAVTPAAAMAIFHRMQHAGAKPDRVTFLTLLNLCAVPGGADHGREIHRILLRHIAASEAELDLPLANALADMYCKNGLLDHGRRVFESLKDRGDVISWNAMITAYAQQGHPSEALCLFRAMELYGIPPGPVTYTLLLSATISAANRSGASPLRSRSMTKFFHDRIRRDGLEFDLIVGTGLVNLYASFGHMDEAATIFFQIVERSSSDVVLWTTMIGIYAQRGETSAALGFFRMMQLHGVRPNRVTFINVLTACSSPAALPVGEWIHRHHDERRRWETSIGNALISMYIKCGDLPAARSVFDEMEQQRDVISWNTIIAGYAAADEELLDSAFEILSEMLHDGGTKPDCITIVTLLNACSKPSLLDRGKYLHSIVADCGIGIEFVLFNALIHMYAKCGSLEMASALFQEQQHHRTDASVWAAMIIALSHRGFHREAIRFFQEMEQHGVKPDRVSLTAVLDSAASALDGDDSAAASTARGLYSQSLESGLLIGHPVVATALINLLGVTGSVTDALAVFTGVVERDVVCWNAMLSVYARHGHTARALELFRELQHQGVEPNDVTFVNLISVCSHAGLLDAGVQCLLSMTIDHRLRDLTPELNGCVIDLFARVGRLADAREFVGKMPREDARVIQWMSLLCASRIQGDLEVSGAAAKQVLEIDPSNPAAYVALSIRQSSSAARAIGTV